MHTNADLKENLSAGIVNLRIILSKIKVKNKAKKAVVFCLNG